MRTATRMRRSTVAPADIQARCLWCRRDTMFRYDGEDWVCLRCRRAAVARRGAPRRP
jgi:hypothetical protein